jgi:hypothetical protein
MTKKIQEPEKIDYSTIFHDIPVGDEWLQCERFAKEYDYTAYSKRNQTDDKYKRQQNIIGKAAEVVVYKAISPFFKIDPPDFNIYSRKDKSWKSDSLMRVRDQDIKVHIKGQSFEQGERFGISWVFQKSNSNGRGGKDDIFSDTARGKVFFVSVDEDKRSGIIRAIIPITVLKSTGLIYETPIKPDLARIKTVVYFNSPYKKNIVQLKLDGLSGTIVARNKEKTLMETHR